MENDKKFKKMQVIEISKVKECLEKTKGQLIGSALLLGVGIISKCLKYDSDELYILTNSIVASGGFGMFLTIQNILSLNNVLKNSMEFNTEENIDIIEDNENIERLGRSL